MEGTTFTGAELCGWCVWSRKNKCVMDVTARGLPPPPGSDSLPANCDLKAFFFFFSQNKTKLQLDKKYI